MVSGKIVYDTLHSSSYSMYTIQSVVHSTVHVLIENRYVMVSYGRYASA